MPPLVLYLVIDLCLHACAARPLMVLDVAQFQGLNRIEPETFVSRGNVIAEYGGKISDGTTAIQFENQRTSAVKETEGTTGSPSVKILCSRKILQEAAEKMAWKRFERSTPESPPSNGEETVNSKDNRIAVNVVVIDYEQPHRKPPIHNWEP
ncbi:uncharacterized protein [Primulina huaijiensis]|uniref:uncharacterized protein n=1 Tax=Primulina huaijiensis TaxID=1492673 RepID=UPI003CC78B1B